MGIKNIIESFQTIAPNKDFKHKSLFLNIDYMPNNHIQFELLHAGKSIYKGESRIRVDATIVQLFNSLITRICNSLGVEPIENIQRELTSVTDDLLPKQISDFLIRNKEVFKYLTIDDESVPINVPYGILFFPDSSVVNCLSRYGFFLSEYYTLARTEFSPSTTVMINKILTVSTDDLPGSIAEENEIHNYINNIIPGKAIRVSSKSEFETKIHSQKPNCFHFCCHGDDQCNIIFKKAGTTHVLDVSCFDLFRFSDNSIVFLNICNSNYTIYDNDVPRSISTKIIDRNGGLVVVTEWPIEDSFAFLIGTNVYRMVNGKTMIQIISELKSSARSYDEKITAIAYSLKGNPNIKIQII